MVQPIVKVILRDVASGELSTFEWSHNTYMHMRATHEDSKHVKIEKAEIIGYREV